MVAGGDASPAGGILRGRMKGPLGKTYPLSVAVDAVEQGIESRARRVVAPGWARIVLALRDFVGPLQDREVSKYMPEVERAFNDAIAEQGAEASAPVGAGGQADTRARSSATSG
jgi:hypothetical protein